MEWESAVSLALAVAGLTVGVVVLWGYGQLRRIFNAHMEKQQDRFKKMLDLLDKQQIQIENLNAQVKSLTEQSGKITRVVSGVVERIGGKTGEEPQDPPRMLH